MPKWRSIADVVVSVLVPVYAFAASWFCMRYFMSSPLLEATMNTVVPQEAKALFNMALVGLFLPLTVMGPPVILFAWLKTPILLACISLAIALVTSTTAQVYAVPPDAYLTQPWGVIIGVIVRAPFYAAWAVGLYFLANFRTLTGPREKWPRLL